MLSAPDGGLDFAGLPYAVALFGVQNIESLLLNLTTIKNFKPPKDDPIHAAQGMA
jgi:hypothetical protein